MWPVGHQGLLWLMKSFQCDLQSSLPSHESQATLSLIWLPLSASGHGKQRLGCLANYQETSVSKQMAPGTGKMRNRWGSGGEREACFLHNRLHFQMLTRAKECFWWKVSFSTFFFQGKVHSPSVDLKQGPECSLAIVTIWTSKAMFSVLSTPNLTYLFFAVLIPRSIFIVHFFIVLSSSHHKVNYHGLGTDSFSVLYFQGLNIKLGMCSINVLNNYFKLSWNQTFLPASRTRASSMVDKNTRRCYFGEPQLITTPTVSSCHYVFDHQVNYPWG